MILICIQSIKPELFVKSDCVKSCLPVKRNRNHLIFYISWRKNSWFQKLTPKHENKIYGYILLKELVRVRSLKLNYDELSQRLLITSLTVRKLK